MEDIDGIEDIVEHERFYFLKHIDTHLQPTKITQPNP